MSYLNRGSSRGGGGNNNSNAPLCKFYQEGRCRFGDSCKNYHPPQDSNRGSSSSSSQSLPYHLSRDVIKGDFTFGEERPTWPLSAYGPGKDAPRQLLEGALEQSAEELRLQYYLARASGSTQQYEQTEQAALSHASDRAQQILNDIDGAIKYVMDGTDAHPNREDEVLKPPGNFNWVERPTYDAIAASSTTALGQPNGGSTASSFGQSSTLGAGSAFGQASAPSAGFGGQTGGGSGFGKPSPLGGGPTGFGQPSALGGGLTAFGQASAIGGGPTAFGKPSVMGGGSAFGAQNASTSSPFSQTNTTIGSTPFGQTATAGGTPFGQAGTTGNTPFGQAATTGGTTFGQASNPGTGTGFGQASALGGNALSKSPFGAAASSTPAFGQSGFGAKPAVGAPTAASSTPGFGQSAFGTKPAMSAPAFGQASQPGQQQPAGFGQPSQPGQQPSTFGQASQAGQSTSTFGEASQAGVGQRQPSPFTQATPFGAAAAGGTSTFGQTAFGKPSVIGGASTSPAFGKQTAPAQQQSTFGAPTQPSTFGAPTQPSTFGAPTQPSTFGANGTNTNKHPFGSQQQPSASPGFGGSGQPLPSIKGQRVFKEGPLSFYNNPQTGKKVRIWMPEGAPGPKPEREAGLETYEALGEALKQMYDYVRETGTFKEGVMPEVPPKQEWVSWDL